MKKGTELEDREVERGRESLPVGLTASQRIELSVSPFKNYTIVLVLKCMPYLKCSISDS